MLRSRPKAPTFIMFRLNAFLFNQKIITMLQSQLMITPDHQGLGCTAGFYLERGSAYYILPVLGSTLNVKVHQGSVKLQIQL